MLVARRDPPFHGAARDTAPVNFEANPGSKPPRVVRFVTVIQMVGSLLAVPVGIGSAYTFYRANFSPETTCQSLRSGIIAMLDKGVDASTRRILVRRDVESFEKTCAAVDPEATAAFKALLAAEKSPPLAAAPATKAQPSDAAPKEQVHKAEPRPQATPKQATTNAQVPATQNARRDPPSLTRNGSTPFARHWSRTSRMRGLSRTPSLGRRCNLRHGRRNVTQNRPRRRPLYPPPPQRRPHLPRLRRRHLLLRRLYRRLSLSLLYRCSEMRRSPRIPITRFHQN